MVELDWLIVTYGITSNGYSVVTVISNERCDENLLALLSTLPSHLNYIESLSRNFNLLAYTESKFRITLHWILKKNPD